MTTGDAMIQRRNGGPLIEISNGLGGPAIGVFLLVRDLIDKGGGHGADTTRRLPKPWWSGGYSRSTSPRSPT
jgi:hypothetical protein